MAMEMQLGKLEKVNLREIWKREATDFTHWLSKEENLSILATEIGISMQLERIEANVGRFSADILAKEDKTERMVIIENQLGQTDHDHFGKLFTYGSGYDAGILVWICSDVREEHRKAIDWLNEKTDNSVNIFLVKMEVWKIGDSRPAPKFQIICSPNNWSKTVKEFGINELTETNKLQLEFWTDFNAYLQNNHVNLRSKKPQPQHWYDITLKDIPSTQAYLSLTVSFGQNFIRCEFYIPNNKDLYHSVFQNRSAIEEELDLKLAWQENPKAKASGAHIRNNNIKLKSRGEWREAYKWMVEMAGKFATTFPKYCNIG
ncbi:MAG: DUF4268 domain-containing protein [Dehalococcoidales bacterium]|nr:DUF4268 domain-containing protein [Dehalococcoidales bacterium]